MGSGRGRRGWRTWWRLSQRENETKHQLACPHLPWRRFFTIQSAHIAPFFFSAGHIFQRRQHGCHLVKARGPSHCDTRTASISSPSSFPGQTTDVTLRICASWDAIYNYHRVVPLRAVRILFRSFRSSLCLHPFKEILCDLFTGGFVESDSRLVRVSHILWFSASRI